MILILWKRLPLSPIAMLIRVMLRQVIQHWLMEVGKDMTNGELGGFFKGSVNPATISKSEFCIFSPF